MHGLSEHSMAMFADEHRSADELQWVIQIRRALEEEGENSNEEEEENETQVSIFRVPSMLLLAGNSPCYRPEIVGLGPYHRWKPELRYMDRQKLSAARRAARRHGGFQHLVEKLVSFERRLRASYDDHLRCNGETLAWAFAIDGCFFLELLRLLFPSTGGTSCSLSLKKCTRDMILRDLVLLENQVPLWVLHKLVEKGQSFPAENLGELVKELSPFELTSEDLVFSEGSSHLLEFLYDSVVPKSERNSIRRLSPTDEEKKEEEEEGKISSWLSHGRKLASLLEPMKPLLEIPCRAIASLPAVPPMILLLEHLLSNAQTSEKDENLEAGPMAAEEIAIPSAAELAAAGVRFSPASGGPTRVSFDRETGTFRLPVVTLDQNTETTLRNLVAYEATSPVTGPEFMARYVELMNGIVDSPDDVRLLRESAVVKNFMKNDDVAVGFWSGMSRSVQLTRVPSLDEAIKQVNRYYGRQWRVKLGKILHRRKKARFALPFIVLVFFFFVGLNAFCLFGRCEKRRLQ